MTRHLEAAAAAGGAQASTATTSTPSSRPATRRRRIGPPPSVVLTCFTAAASQTPAVGTMPQSAVPGPRWSAAQPAWRTSGPLALTWSGLLWASRIWIGLTLGAHTINDANDKCGWSTRCDPTSDRRLQPGAEGILQGGKVVGVDRLDQARRSQPNGPFVGRAATSDRPCQLVGGPTGAGDGDHRARDVQAARHVLVGNPAPVDEHGDTGRAAGQLGAYPAIHGAS